jgi:uncharacterized protein (DUF1684 family)
MKNPIQRNKFIHIGTGISILILFCLVSVNWPDSNSAMAESSDSVYEKEINDWHAKRVERLQSEYGWLTLVGLIPLEKGENRFGSADDNDLIFPEKAPAHAGVLTLKDGIVHLDVMDAATITSEDKPVRSMNLGSDADEATTILDMGSFRFYVIKRGENYYIRLKDKEAETLKNFKGIERYPVQNEWRIEARFEPYDPPKKIIIPNALGMESEESCPGAVIFEVNGVTQRLEPMGSSHGGFFFVFADETSGNETYGGGRFLSAESPDADGQVILDFNKAYNPPCVFTPFATCPLPHADNILKAKIEAGEKNYAGAAH